MTVSPAGRRSAALAGAAALILGAALPAAPPGVEPGQWRLTWTLLSIQGGKGIPPRFLDLQTVTDTRCLDRVPALPMPPNVIQGCAVDLESAEADTVQWRGACGDTGRVAGWIRYQGTKLDGALSMETEGVTLRFEVQGGRQGSCP
jgi:hypothetical protein